MKSQEGSFFKYLKILIFQSPLCLGVTQTDHITELVNEWLHTGKFRKVDRMFRTESTYKKEIMDALPFTGHARHKT